MRWRYMTLCACLGGVACLAAYGWGPLGHVYTAEQVTGRSDPDTVFGAVVPDLGQTMFGGGNLGAETRTLTHYHHDLLPLDSPFAEGFWSHNQHWGGDAFAHFYFDPDTDATVLGYLDTRAVQLADEFGIEPRQCTIYTEMAVDYHLRQDNGPGLGRDLLFAALFANPALHEQLADAFAPDLAASSGLTEDEARAKLIQASWFFRVYMAFYGSQLEADDAWIKTVFPIGAMLYSHLDYVTSVAVFHRALDVCADYQAAFGEALPITREHLQAVEGVEARTGADS